MTQLCSVIDGEAAGDQSGFSVSINSNGDRLAIGSYSNPGATSNEGHARIFEFQSGQWQILQNDINAEAADDNFGFSLSMNNRGDRIGIER